MNREYKQITNLSIENSELKKKLTNYGRKIIRLEMELSELKSKLDLDSSSENNLNQEELFDGRNYIYESPDGEKIYRRKFGDYNNREEINV